MRVANRDECGNPFMSDLYKPICFFRDKFLTGKDVLSNWKNIPDSPQNKKAAALKGTAAFAFASSDASVPLSRADLRATSTRQLVYASLNPRIDMRPF